jgi:hypothetical protein
MNRLTHAAAALAVCTGVVAAQSVSFLDFSSLGGMAVNGVAAQSGNRLRLVPSASMQIGSAFYLNPLTVENGFDARFTFQTSTPTGGGADGFAFVVHNDPRGFAAIGADGSAMGYSSYPTSPAGTAIANALVVEFDTFLSTINGVSDLSGNEISVHANGVGDTSYIETASIGRVSPAITFSNAVAHTARAHYVPGTLRVYLDNLTTPVLTTSFHFNSGGTYVLSPFGSSGAMSLLSGGAAWVGFTAATGGSAEIYDLLSFSFEPGILLNLSYNPATFTISLQDLGGDPGDYCFNALTLQQGAYPNGWFYGIDINVIDMAVQFNSGPPFLTTFDALGQYSFSLPGVPPLGLTFYGVALAISPAGIVRKASPPAAVFF